MRIKRLTTIILIIIAALITVSCRGNVTDQNDIENTPEQTADKPSVEQPKPDKSSQEQQDIKTGDIISPSLIYADMLDTQTGWGITEKSVLRTDDGGKTWNDITPDNKSIDLTHAVYFVDKKYGWATTTEDYKKLLVYRTSDGGSTWQSLEIPIEAMGGDILFLDNQHGWIMARQGAGMMHEAVSFLKTNDGGASWQTVSAVKPENEETPGDPPFSGDKTGFSFIDTDNGWITGYTPVSGHLYFYETNDGGKTWSEKSMPIPEQYKNDEFSTYPPFFFNEQDGILPTSNGINKMIFYVTHDGGKTWEYSTPVEKPENGIYAWSFISPSQGWTVGKEALTVTSDGGKTWSTIKSNIDISKISQLDFMSEKIGFAVIDHQLFATNDGGSTWQKTAGK